MRAPENHGYEQVINNPNEPYLNNLIAQRKVNLATNYFAIGHPSLTKYLEVVGASNFGVINDDSPDWHNTNCVSTIDSGIPADETLVEIRPTMSENAASPVAQPARLPSSPRSA